MLRFDEVLLWELSEVILEPERELDEPKKGYFLMRENAEGWDVHKGDT